jgi:hypothetical protein
MGNREPCPLGARNARRRQACEVMGEADAGVVIAAILQRSDPIKRPGTARARRLQLDVPAHKCLYCARIVQVNSMASAAALAKPRRDAQLVSGFLDSIQEPRTPFISPTRFAERSGLSHNALARLAGVHRNTVRVNPASEQLQERLRGMIKIITSAVELTGDIEKALYWFRNEPIADYRRKTAAELVAEGHLEAVLAYLEDLKNGASG